VKSIFHLAFNVSNLDSASQFYAKALGCKQGRRAETWVDFDFFGHQLSLHLGETFHVKSTGLVDNIAVPMPHFGAVLAYEDWSKLAEKLMALKIDFIIKPCVRFAGEIGEQHTMFFLDPFGNPIELKGFANFDKVFT
jgi:extradiol dioxygenase family protein